MGCCSIWAVKGRAPCAYACTYVHPPTHPPTHPPYPPLIHTQAVPANATTEGLGPHPTPLAVEAAVRSHLLDIYRSIEDVPPLMVRLAWHDAGAYFKKSLARSRPVPFLLLHCAVTDCHRIATTATPSSNPHRNVQRQGQYGRPRRLHPLPARVHQR